MEQCYDALNYKEKLEHEGERYEDENYGFKCFNEECSQYSECLPHEDINDDGIECSHCGTIMFVYDFKAKRFV